MHWMLFFFEILKFYMTACNIYSLIGDGDTIQQQPIAVSMSSDRHKSSTQKHKIYQQEISAMQNTLHSAENDNKKTVKSQKSSLIIVISYTIWSDIYCHCRGLWLKLVKVVLYQMIICPSITHPVMSWIHEESFVFLACCHGERGGRKRGKFMRIENHRGLRLVTAQLYQNNTKQNSHTTCNPSLIYLVICSVLPKHKHFQ